MVDDQAKYPNNDRTAVELFAGGGGLAMAVHQAGFRPLLFNEFAARACETLADNGAKRVPRGEKPSLPSLNDDVPLVAGDVKELDMGYLNGKVDVLAGGPPCQPFSLGGVARGDEDKRNMFPEMFRAIREIQPKAVICENVRGLIRPSFRPYFEYIQRELALPFERRGDVAWQEHNEFLLKRFSSTSVPDEERYHVIPVEVNAADYGVPQIRNRVLLIAFRADLGVDIETFTKAVKSTRFSKDALFRSLRDGDYWDRHAAVSPVPDHVIDRVRAQLPDDIKEDDCLPWRTLRDAVRGFGLGEEPDIHGALMPLLTPLPPVRLDQLDGKSVQGGVMDHIGWPGARIYDGHTPNELDRPAKTVKAGVHGVPGGESVVQLDERVPDPSSPEGWRYLHRYMTVRETARVMTFPDNWTLAGPRGEKMRQLGNAVPVTLGRFFAEAVATALAAVGH